MVCDVFNNNVVNNSNYRLRRWLCVAHRTIQGMLYCFFLKYSIPVSRLCFCPFANMEDLSYTHRVEEYEYDKSLSFKLGILIRRISNGLWWMRM